MRVLNLGAGHRKGVDGIHFWPQGTDLEADPPVVTTLDIDESSQPDVVFDLDDVGLEVPLPFTDSSFEQVHAYSVLEHVGWLGDYEWFFATFSEIWRILVPDGKLVIQCPLPEHAWNDPGHRRVISPAMLTFLSQAEYERQVGKTRMTDYRRVYTADLRVVGVYLPEGDTSWIGLLRAVK